MFKRILTALVLAPAVIAAAWFTPDTLGAWLAIAACAIAGHEYLSMFSIRESRPLFWAGLAWIVLGPVAVWFEPRSLFIYLFATPLFVLGLYLVAAERIPQAIREAPALGLGVLYIGLLMVAVVLLAVMPRWGGSGLIILFAVVWLGDSAAYFGGKFLGRHKLHPRVSPKKTVEGSLFGLAGSVGGAFLIHAVCSTPLLPWQLALLGLVGGTAEQVGDLCESILKRSTGIKDSGTLLPGHGGMLDRIDGLLFAAPVVYGAFLLTS